MSRICRRCGEPFEPRTCDVRCATCRPIAERERLVAYARDHADLRRAARHKWSLANPDLDRAVKAHWASENPERGRVARRAHKKRNPETNRSYVRARKARQRGLTVIRFTTEQLLHRLSMWGGRCWMCGAAAACIDHVKPLSKGGAHMLANLRPACALCNGRKGETWPLGGVA